MENKINFEEKIKALSILKWTLKKQLPFSIAYWILLFLAFPAINILIMIISTSDANYGSMSDYIDTMEEGAFLIVGTVFSVVAIAHSVILGIMTFSYMHNKRSVDLYGSLPVSRRTMFFSRYCALVLSNVIPIVVIGTVGALLTFKGSTMLEVYRVLGILILATVGNISFIAFISLCCGTVGYVIVSYAVVNIVYPICVFICNAFPNQIVPGINQNVIPATVYTMFSPVAAHFTALFGTGLKLYAIWWIVFTCVLVAGCFILCKKRKAETAQTAFAFTIVEIVIKFITGFAAGFGLGWVMTYVGYAAGSSETQWLWFLAGSIIGVMVSNGLLHLIYHKGFSKYKSSLKECFIVLITDMAFLIVVTSGLFGYDTRVPEASDVESVYIGFGYWSDEEFLVDGKNLLEDYHSDKEVIESVIESHRAIVENISEEKTKGFLPIINYNDEGYNNLSAPAIEIKYRMKNGTTISRYYEDTYGYVEVDEKLESLSNEELVKLNNIPAKYVSYISLDSESSSDYGFYYLEADSPAFRVNDVEKIAKALRKDVELFGVKLQHFPSDDEIGKYSIEIGYEEPSASRPAYYDDMYYSNEVYVSLYITSEYVNTLKALEETGYGNIRLYTMSEKYPIRDDSKIAGYKQTGKTIYFKTEEEWSDELEVHCVALTKNYEEYEYTMSLFDDMTLCEKVSDGIYKYVLPESIIVKDEISGVLFYQYSDAEMNLEFVTKMGTEEENFLYKGDSFSGEFVWGRYEE